MKFIVFILLLQAMVGCLLAQGDASPFEGLEEAIATVQVESASSPEDVSFENLKRLHVALAANRGNIWMMPDPILNHLRSKMEPIRDVAFGLAASDEKNRRFYGAVFASYLEPTDATKELLEKLAHDDHAPASGTAMDTLFGMGWETQALRGDVVLSLKGELDGEPSIMASLARNNAGEWGVSEAAPILMDLLEKEYNEEGKITSIATQLKLLGEGAKEQLPRLQELLRRVKANPNSHPREIEALDYAVSVISEELKNDPPPETVRRSPVQDSRIVFPEKTAPSERMPNTSATASDGKSKEAADNNIELWPLVLGAVAVLGVAVMLVRAFIRGQAS